MKSTNPILRESLLDDSNSYAITERPMTISGTMSKLLILTLLLFLGAGVTFYQFSLQRYDFVMSLAWGGIIVGLISSVAIAFKHSLVPYLAPVFACSQGLALSAISCFFESVENGIVIQAVSMTFLVVFVMAVLYKLRIIRATEKLRATLFAAAISIAVFYLISIVMHFFGKSIAFFDPSNSFFYSPFAIGVNSVIALIAAFYLILDFDFIEKGVTKPLPALYEWYGAFGLLTTIVWLYIEILRLLARTRNK
ncbi:Bax inhibitor-1/YccA family protein [bacterium]|nr:Bax inhibitor-1/YccA family protein [bacterium]